MGKKDSKNYNATNLDPKKALFALNAKEPDEDEEFPLKEDPDHQKYFRMLKIGLPIVAVKNALVRDGKDSRIIDLNPKKSVKSQLKDDEGEDDRPPFKEDSDFIKYYKMLKMSVPLGAVETTLVRDGKDPNVMDLDPEKSLKSQLRKEEENGPNLKEEPDCAKYFKMLKIGLPMGAVKNTLVRDGKDPMVIDLDPEKYLKSQTDAGSKKEKSIKKSQPRKNEAATLKEQNGEATRKENEAKYQSKKNADNSYFTKKSYSIALQCFVKKLFLFFLSWILMIMLLSSSVRYVQNS